MGITCRLTYLRFEGNSVMALPRILQEAKWAIGHHRQLRDYVELNFLKDDVYRRTIQNSPLFNEAYYRRNTGITDEEDAAEHYLKNWMLPGHDPSEGFCSEEYLSLHGDVALSGLNPLLSYELYGRKTGYEISSLQKTELSFPGDAIYTSKDFDRKPAVHGRAAVVACFFVDGHIPETLRILLKGLLEVTDNIVLIGDCPVYRPELDGLAELVSYAAFIRHDQYDFGSYKKGLAALREKGLLDDADELIMVNDSCYGPVYPLSEAFGRMAQEPCDFWGLSGYRHGKQRFFKNFVSSYFYVFRKKVIESGCLDDFMARIRGPYDRNGVILKLETELTAFLEEQGFLWQTLCADMMLDNIYNPLTLVGKYRVPLVKKKSFQREQREDMNAVLALIRANNEELSRLVRYAPLPLPDYRLPSIAEHRRTLPDKAARIAERIERSERISIVFLTGVWDGFPGRSLFRQMSGNSAYDLTVAVIPDLRKGPDERMTSLIEAASRASQLADEGLPGDSLLYVRPDHLGQWPDVCADADIVVYNSPCGYSSFRYLPKYAAGRAFLPLMVCDADVLGRARSLDAYKYVWKVIPAHQDAGADFLTARSEIKGENHNE